jgi:hypothetical protein
MNITLSASGHWMASLAQLLRGRRIAPTNDPACVAPLSPRKPLFVPVRSASRPAHSAAARPVNTHASRHAACSTLRVVRIVETGQAPALAGRILMSGRMADVCAELDRMVEREAAMRPAA